MTFRPMIRAQQQLSDSDCSSILKNEPRGVLSMLGDDDYPYGIPINYYYDEEDGKIYFHCGKAGHKADAFTRHPKASFCVYDSGTPIDDGLRMTVRSVIVFGRIEIINDQEKVLTAIRKFCLKYSGDDAYIVNKLERSGPRMMMFALVPEHMTGKSVVERQMSR